MPSLYSVTVRSKEGTEQEWKAVFPKGKIYLDNEGKAYLEYNNSYINKFASNQTKVQMFLDETVAKELSAYVSFKTGAQSMSIVLASNYGSGIVTIGVPYAEYQAYSKKIKKRVGKRGTQPFERMRADKKDSILRQTAEYARRLNNG